MNAKVSQDLQLASLRPWRLLVWRLSRVDSARRAKISLQLRKTGTEISLLNLFFLSKSSTDWTWSISIREGDLFHSAINSNVNLIQIHSHLCTKNDGEPNFWTICDSIQLKCNINHHRLNVRKFLLFGNREWAFMYGEWCTTANYSQMTQKKSYAYICICALQKTYKAGKTERWSSKWIRQI